MDEIQIILIQIWGVMTSLLIFAMVVLFLFT